MIKYYMPSKMEQVTPTPHLSECAYCCSVRDRKFLNPKNCNKKSLKSSITLCYHGKSDLKGKGFANVSAVLKQENHEPYVKKVAVNVFLFLPC